MPSFQKISYHMREIANELCASDANESKEQTPECKEQEQKCGEECKEEKECNSSECEQKTKVSLESEDFEQLFERNLQHVRACDRDLFAPTDAAAESNEDESKDEHSDRAIGNVHGMRKVALFHGLNYVGTSAELKGCVNDCNNMQRYLTDYCGLNAFLMMTDFTQIQPTRDLMLQSYAYIANYMARYGGTWFYQYSGHGTQQIDYSGDERTNGGDGKDECLCPLNYNRAGFILDDLLNKVLVQNPAHFNKNFRMICIIDACHSKSVADLRFSYGKATKNGAIERFEPSRDFSYDTNIITISGCRDFETSSDVQPTPQTAYGAMSNALVRTLKEYNGKCTYRQLLEGIYTKLRSFSQIPQLSSEQELDLDSMIDW